MGAAACAAPTGRPLRRRQPAPGTLVVMPSHPYDDLSLRALHERTNAKWARYAEDVLPMWVAEMDFPLAPCIKAAIAKQLDVENLGYTLPTGLPDLFPALRARLASRYGLAMADDNIMMLGSTVQGLHLGARALSGPGDEILLLTPLYPPFKDAVLTTGRVPVEVELHIGDAGYELDMKALEAAVTPATRILMLCNPHNPTGRVMRQDELEALVDFALRHNLWIVSDELHADLVLVGEHLPIAGVSDAAAGRTITLYGPTKAFNVPGLKVSFALAGDVRLLDRLRHVAHGIAPGPNILGIAAAAAAYREGDAWLEQTLGYLRSNRDLLDRFVKERLPEVTMHAPEGTYLAWLDFRRSAFADDPAAALLERAKVALNGGADYGAGGNGFARLNFATSAAILEEGLERIRSALAAA